MPPWSNVHCSRRLPSGCTAHRLGTGASPLPIVDSRTKTMRPCRPVGVGVGIGVQVGAGVGVQVGMTVGAGSAVAAVVAEVIAPWARQPLPSKTIASDRMGIARNRRGTGANRLRIRNLPIEGYQKTRQETRRRCHVRLTIRRRYRY